MSKIIELTKMDTRKILLNISSIETVEANPDTIIILNSGRKLLHRVQIAGGSSWILRLYLV